MMKKMKLTVQSLKIFYVFTFFMNLFVGMLFLGIPLLALKLGANNVALGAIGTLGSLVYILCVPVSGIFADRFPKNLQAGLAAILFGITVCLIPSVPRLSLLYPVVVGYFISLALVWPALESTMSHYFSGPALSRTAGWYNVSWCSGAMVGIYLAGWIYGIKPELVFWIAGGLGIILGAVFAGFFRVPAKKAESENGSEFGPIYYLYLYWLGNGAAYFSLNLIRNIFPKLAVDLGISSSSLGLLLLLLSLAQCLLFIVLNVAVRWHFRFWPLLAAMLLNTAGLLVVFVSKNMPGFGIGFLLIGAGAGITYSGSLYYAISLSSSRAGSRSGWHEFYLGLGALWGPLLGGLFAQYVSPESPYLFSAFLVIAILIVQVFYYRKKTRPA